MFKEKNDGRYRVEVKFTDNTECFLVTDDYSKSREWYNMLRKPGHDPFSRTIIEVIVYDRDEPLAAWCNSIAAA